MSRSSKQKPQQTKCVLLCFSPETIAKNWNNKPATLRNEPFSKTETNKNLAFKIKFH